MLGHIDRADLDSLISAGHLVTKGNRVTEASLVALMTNGVVRELHTVQVDLARRANCRDDWHDYPKR
jgi:hypothetical protein